MNDKYLLGILNSSIMNFLFRKTLPKLRGDFYEPGYVYLKDFPIAKCDQSDKSQKQNYNSIITLVNSMIECHKKICVSKIESDKKLFQQKANIIDSEIDKVVYELYELNADEIAIIEE